MAITAVKLRKHAQPGANFVDFSVTFDNSYAAGGEPISASSQLPNKVHGGIVIKGAGGYVIEVEPQTNFGPTAPKLRVYYADYDAAADGALIEVPTTTDLSSVSCHVRLFGY